MSMDNSEGQGSSLRRDMFPYQSLHATGHTSHAIAQAGNVNLGTNYGYITQHAYIQQTNRSDLISLLNPILDASHTRNMKLSPPNSQCLPGTRREVIRDIRAWADVEDMKANPHLLWIFGYAGCGKSAIAHEIAKLFANENRLAASFAFFRGSGDRNCTARFATTVASQVASAIPEVEPIIESAVRKNPGLLNSTSTSLSEQFRHLVYLPIQRIASQSPLPYIIILDGADECQDHEELSTLIESMVLFFDDQPTTPLRFLITSRVEDHLHQVLHSSDQVRLLNLVRETSDADIAAALDVAIANAKRGRLLACHESWPSLSERQRLVEHIGGSFLFMAVIVKKLFDQNSLDGLTPVERLPLVLSMKADFDELYVSILTPHQRLPHFHAVISTIALAFSPLSIVQLADILGIKTVNVLNVLINLQAIIQVPGDDRTPVTLWHTSLRDFLCTQDRSGPLFANPQHHLRLAYWDSPTQYMFTPRVSSFHYAEQFSLDHLERFLASDSLERGRIASSGQLNKPIFNDGRTGLEVACLAKRWALVRALAEAGVDINTHFHMPQGGAMRALYAACLHEQWELVYFLLEKGADPNIVSFAEGGYQISDDTPLVFAALRGDVKLVSRLLECGADPNLRGGYCGPPLRAACSCGSLEIVKLLLSHGADPNQQEIFGEWSALHECARGGYDTCARALLEHKAHPDIQDKFGNTPLHVACSWGYTEVVECLLEFKADTSIMKKGDLTALQVTQQWNRDDSVEVLRRHGRLE